jgi:hypothetical protein
LAKLANHIQREIAARYEKHLSALDSACAEKETSIRQLRSLRGHPALKINADGSREVGSLRYAGLLPKDPELSPLLKRGGYLERLTSDREFEYCLGSGQSLSTVLEAAIRLEEIYLEGLRRSKEEILALIAKKPETIQWTSVRVASYPKPRSINPRAPIGPVGEISRKIVLDGVGRGAVVSAEALQYAVRDALSGIPEPGEFVKVSVRLCVVCSEFLSARTQAATESLEFADEDDDSGSYSNDSADDNPAEDWQSDSND